MRVTVIAVVLTGCSLTNLDGFTSAGDGGVAGDGAAAADGGAEAAPESSEPYSAAVRADKPAAWYRFDDAPGARVAEDELAAHSANVMGTVNFGAAGVVGKGILFEQAPADGIKTGHLVVGDAFDFSGQGEFAIEAWIRPRHTGIDLRISANALAIASRTIEAGSSTCAPTPRNSTASFGARASGPKVTR
jgi:hypothetical protein